jgi:hypothetical protein
MTRRGSGIGLLAIGTASVAASLVVRLGHRGPYFAEWDLVAATQGHMLASTLSFWEALREVWYQNRHFWIPFPAYAAPFTLTAGYLERLWPSLYWAHALSLLSFVTTLMLIAAATGLPVRRFGGLLLAWGASSTLLSYAVVGYPWASGFLSHALALFVVMNRRLHTRPLLTAGLAALAAESCWHVYQTGRTASLVFLVAVVLMRRVPIATRAIWLVAAGVQILEAGWIHPSPSSTTFFGERLGHLDAAVLWAGVTRFAQALWGFFDLPTVWVLGVASFAFFHRDRGLLLVLLLLHAGFLVFLAIPVGITTADALRPRRFVAVDGYCLVAIGCMLREASVTARRAFVGLLILGNVWQGVDLYRFVRAPRADPEFPLPYTSSSEGVGLASHTSIDVSRALLDRLEAGERILLLYNLSCYPENVTNPQGVIERLYLSLGHERFVRSVIVFGSTACRYNCLPIRPLGEWPAFLDGLQADGTPQSEAITVYYPKICRVSGMGGEEMEEMVAQIRARFPIMTEELAAPHIVRLRLR